MNENLFLLLFFLFTGFLLALDLGVVHKKDREVTFKEAALWTGIYIGIALIFYVFLLLHAEWVHGVENIEQLQALNLKHGHGLNFDGKTFEEGLKMYRHAMSMEYLTGYLIEKSLSLDNIFVMLMIFIGFSVDRKYYHRVLFYGILGAIVLRFIFIFAAAALIQKFHWILLIFGLFLLYTGVKMFVEWFKNKPEKIDVEHHPVVKFLSKHHLSTSQFHGHDFFAKIDGRWLCTPLFVVLVIIEFSDVIFAFDSIPAIFSVTQDPYIVFYSNIFAILGLRSLFFMLESVIDKFRFIKIGLAVLLTFIGAKMLLPWAGIEISTGVSLIVIVAILVLCIVASILFPEKKNTEEVSE